MKKNKLVELIFIVGIVIAIINFKFFFPILLFTLAATSALQALKRGQRGSMYGSIWLMTLGICFLTGQWNLIFIAIGASVVYSIFMGSQAKQSMPPHAQQQTPYYQPSQTPTPQTPPTYQSYDQGYTPRQSAYPPPPEKPISTTTSSMDQYEQPQAMYPEQRQPN